MKRAVYLCVINQLYFEMSEKPTENLWFRIKGRAGTDDITVGFCYRLSNQDNWVEKDLHTEKGADSKYRGIKSMTSSMTSSMMKKIVRVPFKVKLL